MKAYKNSLTLILMSSSIALLLVLQFFWMRGAYTEALDRLKKETDNVFRSTIFTMRDSLMQQTFESLSPDSAMHIVTRRRTMMDSLRGEDENEGRRMVVRVPEVRVFGHPTDENSKGHNRNFHGPAERERDRRDFFFRLGPDSLKIDSIKVHFASGLMQAKINLPFKIVHSKRGEHRRLPANSFISDAVRISPFARYSVIILGVRGMVIREILPQVLFSVFLTLLTVVSFVVLYRSIRAQQKLVQLKNDFISNITHELKTPITTVSVAIEALRNFKGLNNPALTEEYLGIAQNELGRLSILTDKVLKTAIYEDKGISLSLEQIDIEKLSEQVLSSLKLIFEKSSARVHFDKNGNDFTILGDRDHMTNVIYNLLDNAIKYSEPPAELTLSIKENKDFVWLSIGDNGPGIAPEYRKKIFEKFFRVPTGDVHNIKGYGLGLSYVETVVKSHHGTIEVKDNGGKGSCFIITLPKHVRGK